MSDKEKMLDIINRCEYDTVEDILFSYMRKYINDFSASRLINLVNGLNTEFIYERLRDLEHATCVSKEYAFYLKTYLEGNMYTSPEAAKEHLPIQIKNAQKIMDACYRKE